MSKLVLLTASLVFLLLVLSNAHAEVAATVSHSNMTTEQTVELKVSATGNSVGRTMQADFSGLEKDFDILGRSSNSSTVASDGKIEQTQVWSMQLLPKKSGELVIPAFTVNGEKTQPIVVTVTAPRVVPPGGDIGDFHVEVNVDTDRPWVQSQVILTIKVYYSKPLLEGSLSSPDTDGVVVRSLGDDSQYREIRGGKQYSVLERKMALFPQRSGEIELDPIQLSAAISADSTRVQGFFSPRRQIRRNSNALALNVQPRPQDVGGWWLPASNVILDGRWDGDVDQLRVGESITRSLTIQADGVDSTQLPALPQPTSDRFRIYTDQPELASQPVADTLRARRQEKWAIVPRESGPLTLPEVRIPWFNTTSGAMEVVVLPAATINVLPAQTQTPQAVAEVDTSDREQPFPPAPVSSAETAGTVLTPLVDRSDSQSATSESTSSALITPNVAMSSEHGGFWRVVAIAAIVAWLLTMCLCGGIWWRFRSGSETGMPHKQPDSVSVSLNQRNALKAVTSACNDGDVSDAAKAVVAWGEVHFSAHPPVTVIGVSQRVEGTELKHQLEALDASLYARNSPSLDLSRLPDLVRRYIDSSEGSSAESTISSSRKILPEL